MSRVLSANDIFDNDRDLEIIEEPVPEWSKDGEPGVVRLRQMNAEDSTAFTEEMDKPENSREGMFIILVWCAVDAENKPLFTHEDIARLKKKNMRVLNRLQMAALRLNAMMPRKKEEIKNDSGEEVTAGSRTDSPKN